MCKKHNILHVLIVMYEVGPRRKVHSYVLAGIIFLFGLLIAVFAFAAILTGLHVFGWLMYGAMGITIVVAVVGLIWVVRDTLKYIDKNESDGQ